jgi:hypothetical protein
VNALNKSVFNQLSGGTALISALGGTAIYHLQAPDNAPLPYIVYSNMGGGDINDTPSSGIEALEFVRVYHSSAAQAGIIDDLIRARLDDQVLTVTGYTNIWCQREDDYENVDVPQSGARIYAMGGIYRISIT